MKGNKKTIERPCKDKLMKVFELISSREYFLASLYLWPIKIIKEWQQ